MIRLLAPHNIYRIGGFIVDTQKKCLGGYSTSKSSFFCLDNIIFYQCLNRILILFRYEHAYGLRNWLLYQSLFPHEKILSKIGSTKFRVRPYDIPSRYIHTVCGT